MKERVLQCLILIVCLNIGLIKGQNEPADFSGFPDIKTRNPEQTAKWRTGEGKFSAKPKDMWELGIGAGMFLISGDVPPTLPGGFGLGLHVRKSINYLISMRADLNYGQTSGLDYRLIGNALGSAEYRNIATLYGNSPMPRNYRTRFYAADIQGLVNVGNLLFHGSGNKWNAHGILGIGMHSNDTRIDFLNSNGLPYDFSSIPNDASSLGDRRQRRADIRNILDGEYETRGNTRASGIPLNDNMNIVGHVTLGAGITRKINRRLNVGLEYTVRFSGNDHLDGFVFRTPTDLSTNKDIAHMAMVRLGINLGNFDRKIEPLYWVNPLDAVFNDIAELKRRPVFDLTDSDGDGVIDLLDVEPNTPEGAIVDVKGRMIDSDGDGIPDHLDKEPFSPRGFEVDADGVAKVPKYMTEEQVRSIVNEVVNDKIDNIRMEWYLPTIHFDLDKHFIKPEYYTELHQIAQVMKTHPQIKVVVSGHTDNRGSDEYNQILSYNRSEASVQYLVNRYNIPRERFLIQYNGKSDNLVEDLPAKRNISSEKERQQYLNRRVEFRVAMPSDKEMAAPEGAAKAAKEGEKTGTKYSGSRNVGY